MSKYYVPPPRTDDGSDLIYRALTSFGDNIAAAIRMRRERKRDDDRQTALDATRGFYKTGAVPTDVGMQDDSVRAAMATMVGGGRGAPGSAPQDWQDRDVPHPHQMQRLPGTNYVRADYATEQHRDDDRRMRDTARKDRVDAQLDIREAQAEDPSFALPAGADPNDTSVLRRAFADFKGNKARQLEARRQEDQQFQRNSQERAEESAARAERNTARYARNDEIRLGRQRDADDRDKRISALAFSASLIKDPQRRAAETAKWLTPDDTKRLGLSPADIEDGRQRMYGGGQTSTQTDAQQKRARQIWDQAVKSSPYNKQAKTKGLPINPAEAISSYKTVIRPTLSAEEQEVFDQEMATIAAEMVAAQKKTQPKKK